MAKLQVRWRGEVYELPTCLDDKRAELARGQWPDGIVELERVLEPGRESPFSEAERRSLCKMVLRGLGEPLPSLAKSLRDRMRAEVTSKGAKTSASSSAGAGVKPAELVTARSLTHDAIQALARGDTKPAPRKGSAIRKVETLRTREPLDPA